MIRARVRVVIRAKVVIRDSVRVVIRARVGSQGKGDLSHGWGLN